MIELYRDDFSNGFKPYQDDHHLTVPAGWTPDWTQGTKEQTSKGELVQPEFKPRVKDGVTYLGIHTTTATHDGVVWRQFTVPPGALEVRVRVMGDSYRDAGHGMRVGVDQNGHTDFTLDTIQWSQWYSQDIPAWENRKWIDLGVTTETPGTIITIFLHTRNRWRENAAAHFDDVVLLGEGEPEPPPGGVTRAEVRAMIEEFHGWGNQL